MKKAEKLIEQYLGESTPTKAGTYLRARAREAFARMIGSFSLGSAKNAPSWLDTQVFAGTLGLYLTQGISFGGSVLTNAPQFVVPETSIAYFGGGLISEPKVTYKVKGRDTSLSAASNAEIDKAVAAWIAALKPQVIKYKDFNAWLKSQRPNAVKQVK